MEANDDKPDWKEEGRWKTGERVRDQRRGKQMRGRDREMSERRRDKETRG